MPTYDLVCNECGHEFERFLTRIIRDEDRVCPECGSNDVRQGVGGGYVSRPAASRPSGGCVPRGGFG